MSAVAEPITPAVKARASLVAALALRGYAVHELATGGFLVVWQGHSRHCSDLDELARFARQVGAAR